VHQVADERHLGAGVDQHDQAVDPDQPAPDQGRRIAEDVIAAYASCPVAEVARLGRTLRAWRTQILAYCTTDGASNGGTEAINGLIEKSRRIAHGFRNFTNYRLPTTDPARHRRHTPLATGSNHLSTRAAWWPAHTQGRPDLLLPTGGRTRRSQRLHPAGPAADHRVRRGKRPRRRPGRPAARLAGATASTPLDHPGLVEAGESTR
jgi:Transposase